MTHTCRCGVYIHHSRRTSATAGRVNPRRNPEPAPGVGRLRPVPRHAVDAPNTWATGDPWHAHPLHDDAPAYAHVCQQIADALRQALDAQGLSLRALAAQAGIDHGTISRVLAGHHVPDVVTLVVVEDVLQTTLWPTRH